MKPLVAELPGSNLFFPRSDHIRGPKETHLMGLRGQLVLDGDCLRLETPGPAQSP